MKTGLDPELIGTPPGPPPPQSPALATVAPIPSDPDDRWGGHALPSDHPAWMRDVVSLSARARGLVAKLQPVVVRVIGAFEHRLRAIVVSGRRLSVDFSGCYRVE
ncbi:MAG: hypothetical protein ACREQ5_26015 [Candidatus Dormibacteria bacterium]